MFGTSATKRFVLLTMSLVLTACPGPEHQPGHFTPEFLECVAPEDWIGHSCAEICVEISQDLAVPRPDCGLCEDTVARGYKRLDACAKGEAEYSQPLGQNCDEPFSESLTDSIYFVSCCCYQERP